MAKKEYEDIITLRQWISTQDYQGQYSFGIETLTGFGWTP
jgi:hypothetical protein